MASLYCEDDGLEILEELKKDVSDPQGGYTKVIVGPFAMRSECRCDSCNRPIRPGDVAVYVSHHNKKQPDNYGERDYLDMAKSKTHKLP